MRLAYVACAVVTSCAAASGAAAHDRSASRVRVVVTDGGARIDLELSDLDRSALASGGIERHDELAEHSMRAVVLATERGACAADAGSFRELSSSTGTSRWEWRVRCDGTPARLRALPVPSRPSHVSFVRIIPREGSTPIALQDHVLSELAPVVELRTAPPSEGEAFARYLPIGFEHILGGLDHLAFVLLLLLGASSLRRAMILATGFTVGHSVTLAAAALGTVAPNGPIVEAMIGLSIVLVAIDAASRDLETPSMVAPIAAGLFGLLHGLGFAGALRDVGLPPEGAVVALLGFNVGVELGQIAVVLAAWPLLAWSRRAEARRALTTELCAAAGVCAGTFWLVTRILG